MTSTPASTSAPTLTVEQGAALVERVRSSVSQYVVGQEATVHDALVAYLARGHVLIEGVPGTAKTLLVRALAAALGLRFSRIQFTPDLMPSDVTGVNVLRDPAKGFEFHRGPVFASIVLADEINRASPKTQSALLEVMEESRITVDGVTHDVGRPFLVIATQNPIEQAGTYKLPEAQLDRFLVKTSIGYPDLAVAERILAGAADRNPSAHLPAIITTGAVADMADLAGTVHVDPAVLRYTAQLAEATRNDPATRVGVSVRGSLAMIRVAKVYAAAQGRHFVLPDDVKALVAPVWTHRLVLDPEAEFAGTSAETVIGRVLESVAAPQARSAA